MRFSLFFLTHHVNTVACLKVRVKFVMQHCQPVGCSGVTINKQYHFLPPIFGGFLTQKWDSFEINKTNK